MKTYANISRMISTYLKLEILSREIKLFKLSKGSRALFRHECSHRCYSTTVDADSLPSPQEVTSILSKFEFTKEFTTGPVKYYDTNQLPSNDPNEDTRSEAECLANSGLLVGVFDGHGGPAASRVIAQRLLQYVAAGLLPPDVLKKYIQDGASEKLLQTFNETVQVIGSLKETYDNSYQRYLKKLQKRHSIKVVTVPDAIEGAFLDLDSDMSNEALQSAERGDEAIIQAHTLAVALSGAVACLAYIDGPTLHVASVGDCAAVLGTQDDDGRWSARKITREHNAENADEVKRIRQQHPPSERATVLRRDRLLGELAPLRSMADCRYKWPKDTLLNLAGENALPPYYRTPPYLSSTPDLYKLRLTRHDRFLILATDGLWDALLPLQAVRAVGEHALGAASPEPISLSLPGHPPLGAISDALRLRRDRIARAPPDRNAATHLVRRALAGSPYIGGSESARLAHLLALTPDVSRMFRDDITVTVLFFDTDYLRHCPA